MKLNNRISAICVIVIIQLNVGLCKRIRKRQIYREQVQPHTGGKIPDSAFETDRLLLNRLQKEGIAVPDGVVLEQRNPKVYPYPNNDLRPVFKVQLTSDNRYTDENGQMVYDMGPVSETTYPIPQITVDRLPHNAIQTSVYQPIYRPFELPNPYLQHPPLSPSGISFSTSEALPPHKGFYGTIANSHNIFHSPLPNYGPNYNHYHYKYPYSYSLLKYYYEDYVTHQIFDDLSTLIGRVGQAIPFTYPLR